MKAGDVEITPKQLSYYENYDRIFRNPPERVEVKRDPYGGQPIPAMSAGEVCVFLRGSGRRS